MYILYADESGNTGTDFDNSQQPIFVLGSVLVNENNWHNINRLLDDKKAEIDPYFKNNEVHTNEIFNSKKRTYFGKNDWHKNLEILEKLVVLISNLPIEFYYIAIDKKAFKKELKAKYGELVKIDPYLHSFSKLYTAICNNMKNKESNSMIFLDKQLNFNKELASFFPVIHQKYVDNIIEYPMFLDSDSTNYIQIADILSFYVNKYYSIQNGYQKYGEEKEKHCLAMFKELSKNIIVSIKNFD